MNTRTSVAYLYGRVRVQKVLQAEVAAAVEVVPAELLHQLEVVQTVSQRHGLLEADICSARGGVRRKGTHTHTQAGGRRPSRKEEKDKAYLVFKVRR